MRRRVEETLDLLGIADLRARDLRTLSGGQQQRGGHRVGADHAPRLLVLDEPTSALDPTAAEEVLATPDPARARPGVSVLLAEHRLEQGRPLRRPDVPDDRGGTGARGRARRAAGRPLPVVPPIVELGRAAGWHPLPLSVRDARRRAQAWPTGCPPAEAITEVVAETTPAVEVRGSRSRHGRVVALRHVDLALGAGRSPL